MGEQPVLQQPLPQQPLPQPLPQRPLLLVICGPTAVGKSALALRLAVRLRGEIISGDSAQVYRGMDIGTAKPTREERELVPHHLVDVRDPDERWNVADFRQAVDDLVPRIAARGHLPMLVGGSMLYIRAVTAAYAFPAEAYDPQVRAQLYEEARRVGSEELHRRLQEVDPEAAARIHPHDWRRITRAWEVFLITGEPISRHAARRQPGPYRLLVVGLNRPRAVLYRRIDARVRQMIDQGLAGEVAALLQRGYSPHLPSMQALGYREMVDHLHGLTTREEAERILGRNTRHFARRQLSWMRREEDMIWIDLGDDIQEEQGIGGQEKSGEEKVVELVEGNRRQP